MVKARDHKCVTSNPITVLKPPSIQFKELPWTQSNIQYSTFHNAFQNSFTEYHACIYYCLKQLPKQPKVTVTKKKQHKIKLHKVAEGKNLVRKQTQDEPILLQHYSTCT